MKDVRVVFTASQTWFGKLIRKVTRSKVSHVYIEIPIWGSRFAVEATVSGVRIVPAEKAWHSVVYVYKCLFDTRDGLKAVAAELGSPYDWVGTFFLGLLIIIGRWFKLKWKALRWRTKALKCSELVALFFTRSGLMDKELVRAEIVTPDMLLLKCQLSRLFEMEC